MRPGDMLGPYRVEEKLGEGGMGEVYKARDTRLDRTVAIKVLPPDVSADPDRRARFEREAKTIAGLNHPNICTLYDTGCERPTHGFGSPGSGAPPLGPQSSPLSPDEPVRFLVMEHLAGDTLADRLEKGPLPLEQALTVATEIADALTAAHRQGVIHRDLKPANVMLTKAGAARQSSPQTKLLDFGLAKLTGHGEQAAVSMLASVPTALLAGPAAAPITGEGMIVGTLQYMAPEQVEGKPADARTDLWALGALIYEMVTGKRAFQATSAVSLIAAILEREPPPMASIQQLTPPALDRLVRRCLAKSPDDRWDSAHDVADELRWVRETSGVAQAVAGIRPGRRLAARPMLVVLGLAAASAAGAGAAWFWQSSRPQPPARVVRFTIDLPPNRAAASVTLSADGRRVAYVGTENGHRQIFVRSFDTDVEIALAGTDDARSPFFSPDGHRVGFFTGTMMMAVAASGGQLSPIWRLPDVQFANRSNAAVWLDEGAIVCAAGGAGLWRVPTSGEGARRIATIDQSRGERSFGRPAALPGGQEVAVPVAGGATLDPTPLVLVSLRDGTRRPFADEGTVPAYATSGHVVYLVNGSIVAAPLDAVARPGADSVIPVLDNVAQFAMAPNGDLAYVERAPAPQCTLIRMDRHGAISEIAALPRGTGTWACPSLSPDGRRIAAYTHGANGAEVWTIDVERGATTLVSKDGDAHAAVWSADGQSVLFSSHKGRPVCNLFVQNADGSGTAHALVSSPLHLDPGSVSPDGRELAYAQSSPETGYDLAVLDIASGRSTVFRQTPANESQPRISPDGAWIAYQSDDTQARPEVYLEPFPRGGPRTRISVNGGSEPVWCGGAKPAVIYRETAARVMSVSLSFAGATVRPGKPEPLFEGAFANGGTLSSAFGTPNYAVSPDCQQLYAIRETPPPPSPARMHIVLGWLDEFRQRSNWK